MIIYPHNKRKVDVQANIQRFEEYKLKGALFAWQLSTKDCPAGRRDLTQGDLETFIHPRGLALQGWTHVV